MTAEPIRLPYTEQRYPVADTFPVEHWTHPTDGTKPRRYGYTVVILAGRNGNIVRGGT